MAAFAAKTVLLRKRIPYLFGLQVTDRCNLDCFYCEGKNAGKIHLSFERIGELLDRAVERGNRSLYITGGEPTLWSDGKKTLGDIVDRALTAGFFDVLVYTNGTRHLDIDGASWVVTVDGPRDMHDAVRGGTYDRIMENVRGCAGKRVFASITLNKDNAQHIERFIREISGYGIFRGILFNTLTHWPDIVARHGMPEETRRDVLGTIWRMKREGYPILLSRAAYRAFLRNDWKRPIHQIELCTGDDIFTCCRDVGNREICEKCGYLGSVEISQVLALKPSALFEVFKLL